MIQGHRWGVIAILFAAVVWGTTGAAATFAPDVSAAAIGAAAMGLGGIAQALWAGRGILNQRTRLWQQRRHRFERDRRFRQLRRAEEGDGPAARLATARVDTVESLQLLGRREGDDGIDVATATREKVQDNFARRYEPPGMIDFADAPDPPEQGRSDIGDEQDTQGAGSGGAQLLGLAYQQIEQRIVFERMRFRRHRRIEVVVADLLVLGVLYLNVESLGLKAQPGRAGLARADPTRDRGAFIVGETVAAGRQPTTDIATVNVPTLFAISEIEIVARSLAGAAGGLADLDRDRIHVFLAGDRIVGRGRDFDGGGATFDEGVGDRVGTPVVSPPFRLDLQIPERLDRPEQGKFHFRGQRLVDMFSIVESAHEVSALFRPEDRCEGIEH